MAGFIGGFWGNLQQQGLQEALTGSPSPLSIEDALAAGISGAVIGAFNPVSGVEQFVTAVITGVGQGIAVGILQSSANAAEAPNSQEASYRPPMPVPTPDGCP